MNRLRPAPRGWMVLALLIAFTLGITTGHIDPFC